MSYKRLTRNQHFRSPGPKRLLSLDGGGVRGIATLAYLKKIEDLLRERHGGRADFRLCHYFDLIAGTSTGSIIAGALAQGTSVDELTEVYLRLARTKDDLPEPEAPTTMSMPGDPRPSSSKPKRVSFSRPKKTPASSSVNASRPR